MMPSLKSELRKLLSIRSTYIIIASIFALITLFTYLGTSASTYEEAKCVETGEVLYSLDYTNERLYDTSPEDICGGQVSYEEISIKQLSEDKLLYNLQESIPLVATFLAVIVVLFMAHEFRYNIINYTLTNSNNRSKVLLSKLMVSAGLAIIVSLLAIGLTVQITQLAANLKGLSLPAQDYDWLYVAGRHVAYVVGYCLLYLGIVTLLRSLTAGIAAILLLPILDAMASGLLSLQNIESTKFLPYSALNRFGSVAADVSSNPELMKFMSETSSGPAPVVAAGLVVLVWLVGLWLTAWMLFLRRDAS